MWSRATFVTGRGFPPSRARFSSPFPASNCANATKPSGAAAPPGFTTSPIPKPPPGCNAERSVMCVPPAPGSWPRRTPAATFRSRADCVSSVMTAPAWPIRWSCWRRHIVRKGADTCRSGSRLTLMKRWTILLTWVLAVCAATRRSSAAPAGESGLPMAVTVCGVCHSDKDIEERLEVLKGLGVTSIQTYVYWIKVEKTPGVLDWSEYDADVALFKKHGLRWVPFVIAGPWYVTPEFVRQDQQIVMLRCLEHSRASGIPSIWSGRLRKYVRTYLGKFAEHYRPMGILESVNLGISGDYGEAIYSVVGNWPGEYHSHPGYWCGDPLAVADFRQAVRDLYPGGIAVLNQAWHSHYTSFDEL